MLPNLPHTPAPEAALLSRPLLAGTVQAGFPSPADDYMERSLDLNEELIHRPHATFFLRAAGHSMVGAGIHDGDLLIVDRAAPPRPGLVVVAIVDGEFTLKRLAQTNNGLALEPEHPGYQPIAVGEDTDVRIWGVVTFVVHRP
ncbi:MAG: peptidase S24 [Phycisphaerae bacterium]|nr:peptidase S24 [Phycisphaerae bacterium]